MPLKKSVKTINLAKGLDTKTDPVQVHNSLLTLENGVFTSPGKIKKRNGYSSVDYDTVNGEDTTDPSSLITHDDQILIAGNVVKKTGAPTSIQQGHKLVLVDTENSKNIDLDDYRAVSVSSENVSRSEPNTNMPDVAIIGDVVLYAFEVGGEARAIAKDLDNDSTINRDITLGSLAYKGPKLLITPTQNQFRVWTIDGSNNRIAQSSLADTGLGTASQVTKMTDAHVDEIFDAANVVTTSYGNYAQAVVYKSTSGALPTYMRVFNEAGTQIGFNSWAEDPQAVCVETVTDINDTGTSWVAVAMQTDPTTSNTVKVGLFSTTDFITGAWGGPFVTLGTYSVSARNIAIIDFPEYLPDLSTASSFLVMVELEYTTGVNTFNTSIDIYRVDFTAGVSSLVETFRHQGLAARPFIEGTRVYIPTVVGSDIQSTYYLNRFSEGTNQTYLTAKVLQNRGDGLSERPGNGLGKCVYDTVDEAWIQPVLRRDRLASQGLILKSLKAARWDFNVAALQYEKMDAVTHIGSGYMGSYDGSYLFTTSLSYFAEQVITSNQGAGNVPQGVRFYRVGYEWTDHAGEIHRIISVAYSFEVLSVDSIVRHVVPTLTIGHYRPMTETRIYIYRRHATIGTYYKINQSAINSLTADTVTIDDNTTETALELNEIDWTTGGVFENIPPSPTDLVTIRRDRLFWVASDNQIRVCYSKKKVYGLGLEWTDTFFKDVPSGGPITGLGELDDKIIVFKKNTIRYFAGEGPNSFGAGTFSNDALITADVGCSEPNSIQKTQAGLFFKSPKGIYLLARNLQTMYVGAQVEAYNDSAIVRTMSHPTKTRVHFFLDSGEVLIWDYQVNTWSVWTPYPDAVDASIARDKIYWMDSSGVLYQETSGFFDVDSEIKLKVGFEWVNLAGISGYQRVWWITFEGRLKSPHTFTVNLYYDYDDLLPAETFTVNPSSDPMRFRVMPGRQTCQAIRVEIEDSSQYETGEGFELSAIHFEIGIESSNAKIRASKTY